MNSRRLACLLLFTAAAPCLRADDDFTPEQEKFFKIPEATWRMESKPLTLADLPEDLRALALHAAPKVKDKAPEDCLRGAATDLNGDGSKEYFIATEGGGSGGSMYAVFSKIDGVWKEILNSQGSFQAIPGKDKWPELISIARGGGGHYARCWAHMKNGKYEEYRIDHYDHYNGGKITTEEVKPQPK